MITTPAQRRATANAFKKREEAGWKRATFWLSAESRAQLDALKAASGKSKDALIAAGIAALGKPQAPPQDPTPSTGSLIDGGKKTGAERSKAPAATVPAAKVAKGAQRAPEPAGEDDKPLRFPRAPFGSLAKKPKGAKR